MNPLGLTLIALAVISYGLVSRRLEKSILTPPMAFVLFGLALGPLALNIFHFDLESEFIKFLAEITLVIILFCDASRIRYSDLKTNAQIPMRMLGIGLPLTLALGTGVVLLIFGELEFWEAALLAAILTPTDAALGQAVVNNPEVPVRMRQAISVESGMNDGLMLPIVLFLIDMAILSPATHSSGFWLGFIMQQILLGVVIGAVVAYVGGRLLERGIVSGAMNHVFQEISSIALALGCFAIAELLGGNGFISAFVGGLALGNTAPNVRSSLYEFADAEGQLLTLLTFLGFGSGMIAFALYQPDLNWPMVLLFSLLSLTIVRMLPIAISLLGMRLRAVSFLYLGWFGPRGIASILFGLLVLEQSGIARHEEIFAIAVVTITLSIFAHGLSAWPLSRLYARRLERTDTESNGMPEHIRVPDFHSRFTYKRDS